MNLIQIFDFFNWIEFDQTRLKFIKLGEFLLFYLDDV
jgi:hypothetical protein